MPKDYAKITTKNKKRPLSHRDQKKSKMERRLWLFAIVVTGLFILGLVYLKKESEKRSAPPAREVSKPTPDVNKPVLPQPNFDFNTTAPNIQEHDSKEQVETNSETSVNKTADSSPDSAVAAAQAEVAALAKEQLDQESEQVTPETSNSTLPQPSSYILQFAVFRHFADADALKAELGLLGLEVKINTLKKDNVILYRVWTGPFNTQEEAEQQYHEFETQHIKSKIIGRL